MAASLPLAGLPLAPAREVTFEVDQGTWLSLDISPDGGAIVFELLGDLYVLDAGGGQAQPITGSMAFNSQPAFSPDGALIAFVSDASGAENLWVARPDGSEARRVTENVGANAFISPAWAPDGRSLFASLYRADRNAIELWRFGLDGGDARELTGGAFSALGAAPAPDGRHLYAAVREGPVFEDDVILPRWRIARIDLASGARETVVTHQGSAMRPRLTPDGQTLVYAARFGSRTGLRRRDLAEDSDRWLVWPIERDAQEALPTRDLVPGYAVTPDGESVIVSRDGGIRRIAIADGRQEIIPFRARVRRGLGPLLRHSMKDDEGSVRARIVSGPTQSPDGRRLAFSALGRVFVTDLPSGAPSPLAPDGAPGFMPAWSPDGEEIVFVTWTAAEAGQVWIARAAGDGAPRRVTSRAAYYTHPVFSPDGRSILVLRSSHCERLHTYMEPVFTGRAFGALRQAELVEISLDGGAERVVASGQMSGHAQFTREPGVVYLLFEDGLNRVSLGDGERRPVLQVVGPGYYFLEAPQPADALKISPDGRWVLVQHVQQLHLIALPVESGGAPPVVDLTAPSVPHRRLTGVGADFFGWADQGRSITWAIGARFMRRSLDSVTPEAGAETVDKSTPAVAIAVEVPRDRPEGAVVLRGACAITMRGDEQISAADIAIEDGRIVAIGPVGAVSIPAGAEIRDVAGAFIIPGFIDAHAHWSCVRRGVLDLHSWDLEASLAYGVTAGLDPSTLSIDLIAYRDLQEAGLILGPRLYSTGVAVFSFNAFKSLEETRDGLTRYARDYRTGNLKQYRTGSRQVRQWVAMAARELALTPTCEGALDMKLDLTQVLDGFAGNEHALGVTALYDDVVQLLAQARTSYVLTLQCSHGGPQGLNAFIETHRPLHDAKLARFFPPFMLERLFARGRWADPGEYVYPEVAAGAAKVARAGGLVGVGSHGNVAGLGMHWEIHAHVAGGFSPHEALRAATLGSAETIGRHAQLGSLERGKYADLLILSRDPLDDIGNTLSLTQVMQNGRLFDADTLDEVWPRRRARPHPWFADDRPADA